MTAVVKFLLTVAGAYLAVGVLFASAFHPRGLRRVDAAAAGAGVGFRMLITPGVIALWPLLALRWWRPVVTEEFLGNAELPVSPRALRRGHQWAWRLLAVLGPMILAAALWWRPQSNPGSPIPKPGAPAALRMPPAPRGLP
jgi:nitrate/nitrite transporter NarK